MTHEEARIVLLEAAMIQSYHTISFLHGCLTSPGFSYDYPEQTSERLKRITDLVKIPKSCFHSRKHEGCEACVASIDRQQKVSQARACLAINQTRNNCPLSL